MEFKILTIKEFENRINEFCELYRHCFSGIINENMVRWRYIDNPYKDLLVCVAIDNGKIVANYAASPCELIQNGSVNKAALILNIMTHPEYRGKGLFTRLSSMLHEEMDRRGYRYGFVFPNYLSNPAYETTLGWTLMYEIPTLELNLSNFQKDIPVNVQVEEDDAFQRKYIEPRHIRKQIYLRKTSKYLRWRYYLNEQNKYKNFVILDQSNYVKSFMICKEYNEKINIVDFSISSSNDMKMLVNRVIEFALSLNKVKVTIWAQIGTDEHTQLERLGFRNNYPITYFRANLFGESNNASQFYDFRNWFIQAGDDNVY